MKIKSFFRAPDGSGAFKGGTDPVVVLIGGNDTVDSHCDDGFVAVTETEAERSDLPVGVRA